MCASSYLLVGSSATFFLFVCVFFDIFWWVPRSLPPCIFIRSDVCLITFVRGFFVFVDGFLDDLGGSPDTHGRWLGHFSVLQCVAVCCSVPQCVAVCYSVLRCVVVCS